VASPGSQFSGQNWLIVPATPLLPPDEIRYQLWLLTLTGVYTVPFGPRGEGEDGWLLGTESILPDVQTPLNFALDLYGIPHPGSEPGHILPFFSLEPGDAPYVNVGGVFAKVGVGAGTSFEVSSWETTTATVLDYQGNTAEWVFAGVNVNLQTRNLDTISRIGYDFTFRGQIIFAEG
jgi:hypothetical protein